MIKSSELESGFYWIKTIYIDGWTIAFYDSLKDNWLSLFYQLLRGSPDLKWDELAELDCTKLKHDRLNEADNIRRS